MLLREQIKQITDTFATTIIETLRSATLEQLGELDGDGAHLPVPRGIRGVDRGGHAWERVPRTTKTTKSGRLARRSDTEIATMIGKVATLLSDAPLRAEHIRSKLDLDVREMPRILREGVASKKIAIIAGQKRATVYGLPGAKVGGGKKVAKKAAKKVAKKARKK